MGNYSAALDCLQRCLEVQEKKLGKTHPSTLTTLLNVAATYFGKRNYPKAEEMYNPEVFGRSKAEVIVIAKA